jgi:hypothetical protein
VLRDQAVRDTIFGYLADMLRPHGVPFEAARFLAGNQNSYAFLASQCLTAMREETEPDLVVLAHATADCESSRSLSGYLSTLFRGEPLCFAISDQGELSPFTALQVLGGFGTTSRRALVMVLDQSTLAYARSTDPGASPADASPAGDAPTDHVLGLLFVTGPLAAVWHRPELTPDMLTPALAEIADALPDPAAGEVASGMTVVAAEHLPTAALAPLLREAGGGRRRLCRTPPGPGCVTPWAGLAGLADSAEDRADDSAADRVLVVGYDRSLARLSVALFDPVTTGPPPSE